MHASRRITTTAEMAAGVIGLAAASAPGTAPFRAARRAGARVTRELRSLASRTPGVVYHVARRRPDPDVDDRVLADRIRSALGPLEHDLDVPRVHVMVDDHVALLHGDVPNDAAAIRIERAVLHVSGVRGIESHLHSGLVPGDTRPSEGRAHARPDARRGSGRDPGPRPRR